MSELISFLRVLHIVTAILMAWPFYALVAVNQRVRLGPPLGDRADTLVENLVKNRSIPCFVFQGTVLISGLALMNVRGQDLGALISNPILGLKFLILLTVAGLLSYVHFSLQPRIDGLFAEAGYPIAPEHAAQINPLRTLRKKFASICMFLVLVSAMLGAQVWVAFPLWLSAVLVAALGLFTWRAYQSETPYGWL